MHSNHLTYAMKYPNKEMFRIDILFLINQLYAGFEQYTGTLKRLLQYNKEFYKHDIQLNTHIKYAIEDFLKMYIGNVDIIQAYKIITQK